MECPEKADVARRDATEGGDIWESLWGVPVVQEEIEGALRESYVRYLKNICSLGNKNFL